MAKPELKTRILKADDYNRAFGTVRKWLAYKHTRLKFWHIGDDLARWITEQIFIKHTFAFDNQTMIFNNKTDATTNWIHSKRCKSYNYGIIPGDAKDCTGRFATLNFCSKITEAFLRLFDENSSIEFQSWRYSRYSNWLYYDILFMNYFFFLRRHIPRYITQRSQLLFLRSVLHLDSLAKKNLYGFQF